MKSLLILLVSFLVQIVGQIIRYDAVSVWNASRIPVPCLTRMTPTSLKPQFHLSLHCDDICNHVQNTFQKAIQRLNSIQIKQSIHVKLSFYSFCDKQIPHCTSFFGKAIPAAYFHARPSHSTMSFRYPQALLKQLNYGNAVIEFHSFDVLMEINADINFHETDLELVILHLMLHGLGFDSALGRWNHFYPQLKELDSFVTPFLNVIDGKVYGFHPLTVMDRFIQLGEEFLVDQIKQLYNVSFNGVPLTEAIHVLASNPSAMSIAKHLYHAHLHPELLSLSFSNKSVSPLFLHTVPYDDEFAFSHFDFYEYKSCYTCAFAQNYIVLQNG